MGGAWPELRDARGVIAATIAAEEEKFADAFLSGSQRLAVLAEEARAAGQQRLPGASAFLLYDTFGLPLDLQKLLLEAQGLDVDEDGFRSAMAEQRRRSREGSKIPDKIFDEGPLAGVSAKLPATEFVRGTLEVPDAQLLAVVDDGEPAADGEQRRVLLVLDRTPFYAEGGGQVGDRGTLRGQGFSVEVDDTVAVRGITLHRGVVVEGQPAPGQVAARVDGEARAATARNHTGTHLLHAALRRVLGPDCTQAGSLVAPERLRFDFRFPRALTAAEVLAVEDLVNAWILGNAEVQSDEMARDAARQAGAMALFGEKYGEVVRVVRVPDPGRVADSVELCGGTHVLRSGDIGLLRIVSESSIAAGIRRIEARTGLGVLREARAADETLRAAAALVKATPEALPARVAALQDELKSARKELDEVRGRSAASSLAAARREWNGLQVVVTPIEGVPVKTLRDMAGELVKGGCDLVMLAVPEDGGCSLVVAAGPAAQKRGLSANALLSTLTEALGGKGGGSAALAQGRGGASKDLAGVLAGALQSAAAASR
jgi:alanyl-tRNA synthetase